MFGPMLKLSRRMQFIFDHLLPDQPVWDLCCDHGYMGLNAYESGRFPVVHFVDQVPEIINKLENRFDAEYFNPESAWQARFWSCSAESLSELNGTVIIAGVGAHVILRILKGIAAKKGLITARFILGPQRDEALLVDQLNQWGEFQSNYSIRFFCEIQEGQRMRKLYVFDRILS